MPNQTIPEATRQKVLAAAKRLGYTPNGPAQALVAGTRQHGVAVPAGLPAERDRRRSGRRARSGVGRAGTDVGDTYGGPDRQPVLSPAAAVAPVSCGDRRSPCRKRPHRQHRPPGGRRAPRRRRRLLRGRHRVRQRRHPDEHPSRFHVRKPRGGTQRAGPRTRSRQLCCSATQSASSRPAVR
ncbi:hypothetical protein PV333_09555 [Streptomyces sp. NY05-11A]|nr:hypothetical protein [Streptomyces sp. NY05-11A]MDX2676660.1 hypothetical protein [Streptomyces sp. NY05-11A]